VRVAVEQQRGELALMRRAIEGLAAERASIDVPDYSETLGHVVQRLDGVNGRLDQITTAIVKSPALAMTPAQVSAQINRAAADLRSADHAALATATDEMKQQGRELRSVVQSALTARDQKDRQLWFGLGGVAIGIIAWAIVPGLVAREVAPASWQWPERIAARSLDLPRWEAGQRLMQSASPTAFRAIVAGDRIVTANRETIEGCSKAAVRARETVRCTIKVGGNHQ
jgi:hypothetical protein